MTATANRALPGDAPETLIEVGDCVAGSFSVGEGVIATISVCLRPFQDPAAEEYAAPVEAVEAAVAFAVTFEGGGWAYGIQIDRIVRKGAK